MKPDLSRVERKVRFLIPDLRGQTKERSGFIKPDLFRVERKFRLQKPDLSFLLQLNFSHSFKRRIVCPPPIYMVYGGETILVGRLPHGGIRDRDPPPVGGGGEFRQSGRDSPREGSARSFQFIREKLKIFTDRSAINLYRNLFEKLEDFRSPSRVYCSYRYGTREGDLRI